MQRTGVVIDPRYGDHDAGRGHPERPARIAALLELLGGKTRPGLRRLEPRSASVADLALIHDAAYIDRVAATAGESFHVFDPDTSTSPHSWDTARLAAGGVLALLDAVMAGEVDNGFALVRPPGHHAEADRARGFCLFNNIAIGAEHLRRRHGVGRLAIVDWDVHHGNGTQHAFAADPGVLYVSTHQWPHFPGTGRVEEAGEGPGVGCTVNLPLPAGCGDAEYLGVFERIVVPICRQFDPDVVLVSAGFDAHVRDPLAGMRVTTEGFRLLARLVLGAAADSAGGRVVAVLEGGYDLDALRGSVAVVLEEMGGEHLAEPVPPADAPPWLMEPVLAVHRRTWRLDGS